MTCPDCGHPPHIERHEVARVGNDTLYDYEGECLHCGWVGVVDAATFTDAVELAADRAADDAIEDALYDAHDW